MMKSLTSTMLLFTCQVSTRSDLWFVIKEFLRFGNYVSENYALNIKHKVMNNFLTKLVKNYSALLQKLQNGLRSMNQWSSQR